MKLDTARLFVSDLDAAHDFCVTALGLPLKADGREYGYCVFDAGGCTLVVEAVAADAPLEDRRLVGRFTGLSFQVADIDAEYETLRSRGVVFESGRSDKAGAAASQRCATRRATSCRSTRGRAPDGRCDVGGGPHRRHSNT